MIQIQNLSKSFGNLVVLKNINLNFEKGMVYGIVGENGSGKTTLFRSIAGFEKFEGKISSSFEKLKNHIGFLLTEPYFFPKISGKEYISFICHARNISLSHVEEKNIFDLPLNRYASTYSTGMKKKLAIFAILLQNNDVFILDEPFNGVDIQSNMLISGIIKELKKQGKTVIISSHIFSTLQDTCDKIFLLKHNTIEKEYQKNEFLLLEKQMQTAMLKTKIDILFSG